MLLLPCACADELPLQVADAPAIAASRTDEASETKLESPAPVSDDAEPEPEPPPPVRLSPDELEQLLTAAEQHLRALEIKARPRRSARGPLPDASELRLAYSEGRAFVLEGRFDQIRDWAALAKFGSVEPGPHSESSPLSSYDLVITRSSAEQTAYLHVIVPEHGLAKPGARGKHEAWIDGERWINLADVIEPSRDYVLYKSNRHESLHRQWARADVVEGLVDIIHEYRERTGLPLGVGDLSHVTGGKMDDHWTHQKGVDVDVYLLDPSDVDKHGRPRAWWNYFKRGVSGWTSQENGKGEREPALDPDDELSHTATSRRLEILAQIVFAIDEIGYFVHNDPRVLEPFDQQVGERRPGRRYLHAKNRGYWPAHCDHVHLRWVYGELPVGGTPRP